VHFRNVCTLSDIQRWCGAAAGGLKKVQLIRPEDVESLPRTACLTSIPNIALKSGASAYDISFDRQTGRFTEQQVIDDRAGDYFNRTISFQVRRDRVAVLQNVRALMNQRVHVVAYDRNEQYLYLPWMRLAALRDSGQRYSDVHRASFQLRGRFTEPARFFASSPGLTGGEEVTPSAPSQGNNNTVWYKQEFTNMQTNVLVWTQNGGYVPTNPAQYQVYQNGQLLSEDLAQYFVDRNAGINKAHFGIRATTHWNGSNYIIYTQVNE